MTMLKTFKRPRYAYLRSLEQANGQLRRHPVVVVGAGPVGLTAALDLARRGLSVVVLDDNDTVSVGSRAVCHAKRTLEIWDRLGCAEALLAKGVSWRVGKVFFGDALAYQFDLLPEPHHKMPAMINLQQYYVEAHLVEACNADARIDLRWRHKVVNLAQDETGVRLDVETPDGTFQLEADWVVACDGVNSDVRAMVGAAFTGQTFHDKFLIADVMMKADLPTERRFWFDPPFHAGQSVLLHRQADNVWRIDFQLDRDADPEFESQPERVMPRIEAMLGKEIAFELEWVSVYQFACRRIDRFRHGRVLFAGDAAHQVSPFGARGANSGVQDVDNLAWKLALVVAGEAPASLLDSYHDERARAADDNILNSTRSTDFISPKNAASRVYRDAVLDLARDHALARPLVNSGRLSLPTPYRDSPLKTPDRDGFEGGIAPGAAAADAPVEDKGGEGWFLEAIGDGFTLVVFGDVAQASAIGHAALGLKIIVVGRDIFDTTGLLAKRYDAEPGTVYLFRPDQHVAARWRGFDADLIGKALMYATARRAGGS
jgi:3-(3-hydroxy-phenyl)propionate hydroxylase